MGSSTPPCARVGSRMDLAPVRLAAAGADLKELSLDLGKEGRAR